MPPQWPWLAKTVTTCVLKRRERFDLFSQMALSICKPCPKRKTPSKQMLQTINYQARQLVMAINLQTSPNLSIAPRTRKSLARQPLIHYSAMTTFGPSPVISQRQTAKMWIKWWQISWQPTRPRSQITTQPNLSPIPNYKSQNTK